MKVMKHWSKENIKVVSSYTQKGYILTAQTKRWMLNFTANRATANYHLAKKYFETFFFFLQFFSRHVRLLLLLFPFFFHLPRAMYAPLVHSLICARPSPQGKRWAHCPNGICQFLLWFLLAVNLIQFFFKYHLVTYFGERAVRCPRNKNDLPS